ncbi:MAG: SCO family protein [Acidobacteriota bacterium]|nr:SCO family protein [Acidobacteriota bacterium]
MKYLLGLTAVLLAGCARKPLPVLGTVPAFELTDQQGRHFAGAALNGHVWIADFVFTNCEGPCPRMSSRMHKLQGATGPAVHLVSFTVDPDRDTPGVLAAYGKRFGADDSRWTFLTGAKTTLSVLDRDAFHLGTVGDVMEHSTRFVLVDRRGRIRGYYGLADKNLIETLARDAERLEKEPA